MKTVFLVLLLFLTGCFPALSQPQLRAFWVDGYNDGFKTPAQCDLLLARTRAAHMNCVIVQMRKRGDAYYASHYEPWASDDPEHFDALAYLCSAAHAPGLPYVQVYAWVNICAVGGNASPDSIVNRHPEWLSLSDTGSGFDGESTKIDLGNPAAAEWAERVCLDLVQHYPIDGLHLDSIRYGGTGMTLGHWGYNAVSVARYDSRYHVTGQPLWSDPRWMQWRREQVTQFVRRVSVEVHALKPQLVFSAATICWGSAPKNAADYYQKSAAYTGVFADWLGWLQEGLLDLNCPMTYIDEATHPDNWRDWSAFIEDHQARRLSTLAVGTYLNSVPDSLMQISSLSNPSAAGNKAAGVALFSYASTNAVSGQIQQYNSSFYAALRQLFASAVNPPPMPWLAHPRTGTVRGMALNGLSLIPADGKVITAADADHAVTASCDGNGFFAFLRLPPGRYRIDNEKTARVSAGAAVRPVLLIALPKGVPLSAVQGIGRFPNGTRIVIPYAVVTVGSDRLGAFFDIADGFGKAPLRVDAPHLSPPTIKGDLVVVSGTLQHTPTGAVVDAIAVRQAGAELVP